MTRRPCRGQRYLDGRMACLRCGRLLSGERSVKRGYGPGCWRTKQNERESDGEEVEKNEGQKTGAR